MAFELNITAFKNVQWGGAIGDATLVKRGVDWSGATFKMEVRDSKGGATARVTLNNASAGSEGISAAYDANYVHPKTNEVGPATIITLQIDEATMEGLPDDDPNDMVFYYDIHVTPSGEPKRLLCHGTFTVDPGVTV